MEQWNGLPRIIDLPEDYVEALMEESEALEEIMGDCHWYTDEELEEIERQVEEMGREYERQKQRQQTD